MAYCPSHITYNITHTYTHAHAHTHSLSCTVQVFICHDNDTGRELAVKAINVDHIDHAGPSHNSREMLKVHICIHCAVVGDDPYHLVFVW